MTIKTINPSLYEDLMRRMKRIEGQSRGIQRMLEEGEDCEQIVIQLGAIKAAINRVGMKAVACNMGHKILDAVQAGSNPDDAVDELIEQFLKLG
ncbi:MAG TPA: metal-sensitive transcriptional regulator [Symbiobacteriaceae bacterium]